MKIRKNDTVMVISGKDRGKKGKVLTAFPADDKVVVEGVNVVKKHKRAQKKGAKGEMIEFAAPVHVSNVMIIDPKSNKPTRIGKKLVNDKWIRVTKDSGAEL